MTESTDTTGALQHRVTSSLLADQVHAALHDWIATGEWPPGKRLRLREVAKLVGTSEMPVREAFRRLEQGGLISVEPYKGATVRELSVDELDQNYEVRIMLEAEAARLGAPRAGSEVLATMQHHWELLQEASARDDIATAVAEDEAVLDAVYAAGGNEVLRKLVHQVWDSCRPYKVVWVANAHRVGNSAWGHIPRLMTAVEEHDGAAAYEIMAETYRDARATVRDLIPATPGK